MLMAVYFKTCRLLFSGLIAKYLIGASLGPMDTEPYEESISNIALRSYKFIFRSNANYDRGLCDKLIEPKGIAKYKWNGYRPYTGNI